MKAVYLNLLASLLLAPVSAEAGKEADEMREKFKAATVNLNSETHDQAVKELSKRLSVQKLRLTTKSEWRGPIIDADVKTNELGKEVTRMLAEQKSKKWEKKRDGLHSAIGAFDFDVRLEELAEKRERDCAEVGIRSLEKRVQTHGSAAFQVERTAQYAINFHVFDDKGAITETPVFQNRHERTWQLEDCRDFAKNSEGLDPFHYLLGNLNKTSLACRDALGIERPQRPQQFLDPVQLEKMVPIATGR